MLGILVLHHVSLTCADLERAKRFYRDVLGLAEIARPPFDFPGAWFAVAESQQLHLIVSERATRREGKGVDSRDIHFALRVSSFAGALAHLKRCGYATDAADDLRRMRVDAESVAGFPQLYVLDPDRNVIEIN